MCDSKKKKNTEIQVGNPPFNHRLILPMHTPMQTNETDPGSGSRVSKNASFHASLHHFLIHETEGREGNDRETENRSTQGYKKRKKIKAGSRMAIGSINRSYPFFGNGQSAELVIQPARQFTSLSPHGDDRSRAHAIQAGRGLAIDGDEAPPVAGTASGRVTIFVQRIRMEILRRRPDAHEQEAALQAPYDERAAAELDGYCDGLNGDSRSR